MITEFGQYYIVFLQRIIVNNTIVHYINDEHLANFELKLIPMFNQYFDKI